MDVNNLPKVVTRQRGGRGSNSRPLSHQSDALATRLSSHLPFTVAATNQNAVGRAAYIKAKSISSNDLHDIEKTDCHPISWFRLGAELAATVNWVARSDSVQIKLGQLRLDEVK